MITNSKQFIDIYHDHNIFVDYVKKVQNKI
jgi:hypothetical protein